MLERERDVALEVAVRDADGIERFAARHHLALVDDVGEHERPELPHQQREVVHERPRVGERAPSGGEGS